MTPVSDLIAIGLIERDTNNDILWTWCYPGMVVDQRKLLLSKCGLESEYSNRQLQFRYCHHNLSWFYMYISDVFDADKLPRVKQFALVIETRDFNPEKYEALGRILSKSYCKSGNPAVTLNLYLSVIIRGSCTTEENGTFLTKDFDQKSAFAKVSIKELIRLFGLESILIYTALMLKKRVLVYHHKLDSLLKFIRALPALVWHRQNWDILYPHMEITNAEISELSALPYYVAGFCDAAIESRTDLCDLFINLAATEITVPPHSRDSFSMSKTHKEIAVFMVRQSENNDLSEHQVIKEIADKTSELLNNLKSMSKSRDGQDSSKLAISYEDLKEKKYSPALENFLWQLAVAESYIVT